MTSEPVEGPDLGVLLPVPDLRVDLNYRIKGLTPLYQLPLGVEVHSDVLFHSLNSHGEGPLLLQLQISRLKLLHLDDFLSQSAFVNTLR